MTDKKIEIKDTKIEIKDNEIKDNKKTGLGGTAVGVVEQRLKSLKLIAGSLAVLLLATLAYFLSANIGDTGTLNTKKLVSNISENLLIADSEDVNIKITEVESLGQIYKAKMQINDSDPQNIFTNKNADKFILSGGPIEVLGLDELKKQKIEAQKQLDIEKKKAEEERRISSLSLPERISSSKLQMKKVTASDKILGSEKAEIFVIEYSDLECPFCKRYNTSMKSVKEKYKNNAKVAFVFRHFPLDKPFSSELHATATEEAIATECVYKLAGDKKTFEFIDKVFASSKSNGRYDLSKLPGLAVSVGVDEGKFNTCYKNEETMATVRADFQSGANAGVNGTPSVFLQNKDGQTIKVGAEGKTVQSSIESLLK